jgi:hypothetical protein
VFDKKQLKNLGRVQKKNELEYHEDFQPVFDECYTTPTNPTCFLNLNPI